MSRSMVHHQVLLTIYVCLLIRKDRPTSSQAVLTRLFCPQVNYLQMVTLTLLVSADSVNHHIASQEPLLTQFATFDNFALLIA